MIISHKHDFLFLEIPHTGSHSISAELTKFYEGQTILRKHANMSQFMNQANRNEKKYFKFATIRNPLDCMVTHYLKLKSNHKGQYTNPDQLLVNGGHVTDLHVRQYKYTQQEGVEFSDYINKFFNQLYNNWFLIGSHKFDFVIRFENLQNDYAKALNLMKLEQHRPLPHVNPTKGKKKKNYAEYYTNDIIDRVVQNYGPFMQKWGYEFPEEWDTPKISQNNILKFKVKNGIADLLSPYILMDPDAPAIKRIKKLADRVF